MNRAMPFLRLAATASLLLFALGCPAKETPEPAPTAKDTRAQLSIGYSLLYQEADGIPKLKWLLMFKEKPEDVARLIDDLASYYQELAERMKKLASQYPALRTDAKTMSDIEADTRKAMGVDMAKDFVPLAGKTGVQFEREALLMFYNALDEQRHLVGVLLEREPEPGLRKFLTSTKTQLDERHAKVDALLKRRYFVH